jgi:predicted nucleic acid-binding Zn ribbon protein
MRRRGPRPLATVVGDLARDLRPATALARIREVWEEAAGEALAGEAEPVVERGGEVTVACRSAVWAQELELLAPELVQRLNECLREQGGGVRVRALRVTARPPRGGLA